MTTPAAAPGHRPHLDLDPHQEDRMARDTALVDVESSSLTDPHLPEGLRVWELAILRLDPAGRPLDSAWLQITDVDLTHANPVSLDVGRFDQRFHPDGYGALGPARWLAGAGTPTKLVGVTEWRAAAIVAALTDDAVIAGSNPRFDMAALADMLRRHRFAGDELPWYHHPRDVPNVAAGWLQARSQLGVGPLAPDGSHWEAPTYSTSVLSEAAGVPEPADRHAALADVVWMRDLDDVLTGRRKPAPSATVAG